MAIFQADVMICTTVYVRARNAKEAHKKIMFRHETGIDFRDQVLAGDVEVSGMALDAPDFPEICLSPHMTFLVQSKDGQMRTPADFVKTE